MKIETAFDINDKVFFMHENKVQKDVVKKISISIEIPQSTNRKNDDETITTVYDMTDTTLPHGAPLRKDEAELFETKEELLETL